MAEGWVKSFNSEQGYGVITPEDGGADLIVHHSDIQPLGYRSLAEGERVSYSTVTDPAGTVHAVKVTPLGKGTAGQRQADVPPAARPVPPAARPRVSRTAVVLVVSAAVLVLGAMVYTVGTMIGGWASPEWWPYVFGVIIAATLLVGRLVGK